MDTTSARTLYLSYNADSCCCCEEQSSTCSLAVSSWVDGCQLMVGRGVGRLVGDLEACQASEIQMEARRLLRTQPTRPTNNPLPSHLFSLLFPFYSSPRAADGQRLERSERVKRTRREKKLELRLGSVLTRTKLDKV